MLLLAQISDLHLDGTERATERATRVMRRLRTLPRQVDALLVTGDIADHGSPAEYEEAARILAAPFPVLTCPGNHDDRGAYRKVLLGEPATAGPANQARIVGGTAILMCDSTIPGRDEGFLAEGTMRWIAGTLDELGAETPALLALHHSPVDLHHPVHDAIRLRRSQDLADLLAERPQVVAVLAGHAHTPAAATFAGRPLLVGPGVTWTLRMPWEGDELADLDQPPGIAFHVLDDEGGLLTHFRAVV